MNKKLILVLIGAVVLLLAIGRLASWYRYSRLPVIDLKEDQAPPKPAKVLSVAEKDSVNRKNVETTFREIELFVQNTNTSFSNTGARDQLKALSQYWRQLRNTAIAGDKAFDKQSKALEKKLRVYQVKMFPHYRKTFAAYADELLWEEDCDAFTSGKRKEVLTLTGNYFLPNKNKADTYKALADMLRTFRFRKLIFKWFAEYDEYTYYTIESEADSEPVYFN